MDPIEFKKAYYIKLGQGGDWEQSSIEEDKLRLGWRSQTIDDINAERWPQIEEQLRAKDGGKRVGATTRDFNALKIIAQSTPEDVWVTFYQSKMWWVRLNIGSLEKDDTSKFRRTSGSWNDRAVDGKLLAISSLPGKIAQLQGFRGTACRVKEVDLLCRTLIGTLSPLATAISQGRDTLAKHMTAAIKELHWKDFETLVDLVFRDAGWSRVSFLGQQVRDYDLELFDPVTEEKYVVQVKSRAGFADLTSTAAAFSVDDYSRVFFVVHSPAPDLERVAASKVPDHVRIIGPTQLGQLALDAGLAKWIEDKVT